MNFDVAIIRQLQKGPVALKNSARLSSLDDPPRRNFIHTIRIFESAEQCLDAYEPKPTGLGAASPVPNEESEKTTYEPLLIVSLVVCC